MCSLKTLKLTLGAVVPLSSPFLTLKGSFLAPSTVLTLFQIFSHSKRHTVISYFAFSLHFTNECTSLVSEYSFFLISLHSWRIFYLECKSILSTSKYAL